MYFKTKSTMDVKILLIFLASLFGTTVGQLRCYACSFSAVDTDQSCVDVTEDSVSVECSMQYCTILRQEYIDPAGTIASFMRGCEDFPDYLNHEVVDDTFRTFYRACTTDLCNVGNGIQSVVGGNLDPNPQPTGPNLLVPGTGAATHLHTNTAVLFLACSLLRLYG